MFFLHTIERLQFRFLLVLGILFAVLIGLASPSNSEERMRSGVLETRGQIVATPSKVTLTKLNEEVRVQFTLPEPATCEYWDGDPEAPTVYPMQIETYVVRTVEGATELDELVNARSSITGPNTGELFLRPKRNGQTTIQVYSSYSVQGAGPVTGSILTCFQPALIDVRVKVPQLDAYTISLNLFCPSSASVGSPMKCRTYASVSGPGEAKAKRPVKVSVMTREIGAKNWVTRKTLTIRYRDTGYEFSLPNMGTRPIEVRVSSPKATSAQKLVKVKASVSVRMPRVTTVGRDFTVQIRTNPGFSGYCNVGSAFNIRWRQVNLRNGSASIAMYYAAPGLKELRVRCFPPLGSKVPKFTTDAVYTPMWVREY